MITALVVLQTLSLLIQMAHYGLFTRYVRYIAERTGGRLL